MTRPSRPSLPDICPRCGEAYGIHRGWECPDGGEWPKDLVDHMPEDGEILTLACKITSLVSQKQKQYGDSFGKMGPIMAILYPNGIGPDQVDESLTVVRILDKLFRVATNADPTGEDPYQDIAGYCLLAIRRRDK